MIRVLTLDEVAEALRISRRSVAALAASNRLKTLHFGRAVRVSADDLEEFVAECRRGDRPERATPKATAKARPRGPKRVSMEQTARELTGTSGARNGSHSRQRRTRPNTSSTPAGASTGGAASSRGEAS